MKRACPKCKQQLYRQKFWHRRPGKTGRCSGPRQLPVPETISFGRKKAVHFRHFSGPPQTICGLVGGYVRGHYKTPGAQVPWSRIKVDLQQTTCEECLVTIIQQAKERLHNRVKAKSGSLKLRKIIQRAHGQRTMCQLSELVGAS
jgi:hypothetical protein